MNDIVEHRRNDLQRKYNASASIARKWREYKNGLTATSAGK
jgi:predicted amidophosphoribosyltransferase